MRSNRWIQLTAGIIGMIAVSNLQYNWTLFAKPVQDHFGATFAAVTFAYTLFLLTETWLVPFEAYLADRIGPRPLIVLGGLLAALAWTINSLAASLSMIYVGNAIGGVGAGVVYGISIGSALRWFPDRRGLAAGLTASAFGAGSALTIWPMEHTIQTRGYQQAFLWFGLAQGAVVLLTAMVLRVPTAADRLPPAPPRLRQTLHSYSPWQMLRSPLFWLLYLMMTLVATGGLMMTGQIKTLASDLGINDVPVTLLGVTLTALTFAMTLDRVLNGVTRPFFGWVSDHIGRELTMAFAFALEGAAILLWIQFAHVPVLFVLLSGLAFFAWGEVFSLFPALQGDMFGPRFATTNYSLLYTAKGTAALVVLLGGHLRDVTGSWAPGFYLAVGFDWTAALLALLVLLPLRRAAPRQHGERPADKTPKTA